MPRYGAGLVFYKETFAHVGGCPVVSIHRAAKSTNSCKPVFSTLDRYAVGPGQRLGELPDRRGSRHSM